MDVDDILIGDLSCLDIRPDAAAVHHADVGAHHHPVGVGHQVSQIGLAAADPSQAGSGIHGGQGHVGGGHYLVQDAGKVSLERLDVFRRSRILFRVIGHQAGGDLAGGRIDDHFADGVQLGAGLGQMDRLSGCVCHGALIAFVRVPVDEHIDAGGVGDHGFGGVGRGDPQIAQMADGYHVVCALSLHRVHRRLYGRIEQLPVLALAEAVDVIAVLILEMGGGSLGHALRGGDPDISHLDAAVIYDLVGLQHVGVRLQIPEVAGKIRERCPVLRQIDEMVGAVVEFVVPGNSEIVAGLVHQIDQKGSVA